MTQFFSMVLVTLIDDATGETIQTSSMASTDLPESFESEFETTLYLVESASGNKTIPRHEPGAMPPP